VSKTVMRHMTCDNTQGRVIFFLFHFFMIRHFTESFEKI